MVIALVLICFALIAFILFCIVRVSSEYDRRVNDAEQERFIREYREMHSHEQQ